MQTVYSKDGLTATAWLPHRKVGMPDADNQDLTKFIVTSVRVHSWVDVTLGRVRLRAISAFMVGPFRSPQLACVPPQPFRDADMTYPAGDQSFWQSLHVLGDDENDAIGDGNGKFLRAGLWHSALLAGGTLVGYGNRLYVVPHDDLNGLAVNIKKTGAEAFQKYESFVDPTLEFTDELGLIREPDGGAADSGSRQAGASPIKAPSSGHHRLANAKRKQFAEVYLRLETASSEFEFSNEVPDGNISEEFIPAIKQGSLAGLEQISSQKKGLPGVKVVVYDGRYHQVDSSVEAFQEAARLAFLDAARGWFPDSSATSSNDQAGDAVAGKAETDDTEVLELLRSGKKIEAIKRRRELSGEGLKEAKDYVEELAYRHNLGPKPSPSSGCFIATAACGPSDPDVLTLRLYRDTILTRHFPGRLFIRLYARLSPPVASAVEKSCLAKRLARAFIVVPFARLARRKLADRHTER